MAFPTKSTNAGYSRPQQTGGTAGKHPVATDQGRGVTPACDGGTCGADAAAMDSKKHAAPVK